MKMYAIILVNLKTQKSLILETYKTKELAEQYRKNWRRVLGNKNWTIDPDSGLDTLNHLGLKVVGIEVIGGISEYQKITE